MITPDDIVAQLLAKPELTPKCIALLTEIHGGLAWIAELNLPALAALICLQMSIDRAESDLPEETVTEWLEGNEAVWG